MKILLTADWHIRGDRPRCRTDENWLESQREDIMAVKKVAREHRVDAVWILGDLFHQPRCATEAVYQAHHLMLRTDNGDDEEGYAELETSNGKPRTLYATPFGREDMEGLRVFNNDIWATHQLTFPSDKDRPVEGVGVTADDLLEAAPNVRVILTGDYHHGYIHNQGNRRVITPGCLNIQVADMCEYRPRVYILDTDTLEAETVYLEGHRGDIVTDYLVTEKERDERMEKVLSVIGDAEGVSLSFPDNLEREIAKPEYKNAQQVYPELLDKLNKDRK